MPLGWRQIRRGPKHNWTFVTQSEPGCDSRRLSLARGKTPGGYSSINDMLYVRCHSRGYDLWRQAGCEGWSYAKFWFPGLSPRQEHMLEGYPSLNHPESRGDVRLASANPNDPPLIRLNALSTEGDRATGRECARLGRRVCGTQPLADLIVRETSPGPNAVSDVDLDAFTRCSAEVGHHPVGTCAMGASPQAVVGSQLRLRGLEGLRVVDARSCRAFPGARHDAGSGIKSIP